MIEGERQALALRLYDDWQETDTTDSLEIYCYDKGRADAIDELTKALISEIQHKPYMCLDSKDIREIAEKLKENNNEP